MAKAITEAELEAIRANMYGDKYESAVQTVIKDRTYRVVANKRLYTKHPELIPSGELGSIWAECLNRGLL